MTRYGFIATQQGTDVSKAPDYQKVLDSKFPLLEIHEEVDISATHTAGVGLKFQIVYRHNLGYIPAFEWFDKRNSSIIDPVYYITADETNFYIRSEGYFAVDTTPIDGKLIIYTHNLKNTVDPLPSSTQAQTQNVSKYGFKNLNDGTDITSKNYKDFSINTEAKAMSIHMAGVINVDATINYTAVIRHRLGYMPTYLVYSLKDKDNLFPTEAQAISAKNVGAIMFGPQSTQGFYANGLLAPLRSTATQNDITFTGVQSVFIGQLAYVILKDPVSSTL